MYTLNRIIEVFPPNRISEGRNILGACARRARDGLQRLMLRNLVYSEWFILELNKRYDFLQFAW